MLETILAVSVGLILGTIVLKIWPYIIAGLITALVAIIKIVLQILLLPITIVESIISEEWYKTKIVSLYDKIFFEDNSKEIVRNHIKYINLFNIQIVKKRIIKKQKQTIKFLNEAKWSL